MRVLLRRLERVGIRRRVTGLTVQGRKLLALCSILTLSVPGTTWAQQSVISGSLARRLLRQVSREAEERCFDPGLTGLDWDAARAARIFDEGGG